MDITGINNNMINSQIDNAKSQLKKDEFETRLKKAYNEKDEKELKKACKDFEQIFLGIMYKQMKATIPKSDLVENSFAQDTFEGMLDDQIAGEVAKGPGIGLADMMFKSLSREMKSTYKPEGDNKNEGSQDIQQKENK